MNVYLITEQYSEKYVKRLIGKGKTDMEDALKKLDKLTQEEARMIIAENMRVTLAVHEDVRGVTDRMVSVDDRVAGVDDRVACVNDKVVEVIRGT